MESGGGQQAAWKMTCFCEGVETCSDARSARRLNVGGGKLLRVALPG